MSETNPDEGDDNAKKSLSLLHTISSVLAAGLGVQSSKNRERDFKAGRLHVFIITGILLTLLFISVLFFTVKTVLHNAGM